MATPRITRFKSKWLCACAPAVGVAVVRKYFPLIKSISFDATFEATNADDPPTSKNYLNVFIDGKLATSDAGKSTRIDIRAFDEVRVERSNAWDDGRVESAKWTLRFAFDGAASAPLVASGKISGASSARFLAPLASGYFYHSRFLAGVADITLDGVGTYPPCIID